MVMKRFWINAELYKNMRALFLLISIIFNSSGTKAIPGENAQVEVRAVFINCEPNNREGISIDNEATRFEREELFKHSVLQDCIKKIALTVKIASDPSQNSGDEYIPIEHVFQGRNKHVRLLDPYVLRLRREIPLQAYKLRRMATVNGILSNTDDKLVRAPKDPKSRNRFKRSQNSETVGLDQNAQDCEFTENTTMHKSLCSIKRDKRREHNIVVEDEINDEKYPQWFAKDHFIQELDKNKRSHSNFYATSGKHPRDKIERFIRPDDQNINLNSDFHKINQLNDLRRSNSWSAYPNEDLSMRNENPKSANVNSKADWFLEDNRGSDSAYGIKDTNVNENKYQSSDKEFDMYEIGNPDLLYAVQVQLFEKLTTPEGRTVWNDMTRGQPASVSGSSPEWVGQDMNIRYRATEWIPREEFTLPLTSLCLLTPLATLESKVSDDENVGSNDVKEKYIVVPRDDIVGLENENGNVEKRDGNSTDVHSAEQIQQSKPRVMIRTSRAIFGSEEDNYNIAREGTDQFLTMPYHRPHHAQIDLEARADENQLVPIGSFGRIMTVVADSSRRTRTALTVRITNTGLAAAKFRAVARDCVPEFMGSHNGKVGEALTDSPILLPPRHTRSVRLDVPVEIPADVAHCLVSLINDDDESVAVRDVTIKKGDRCFCVWHCECVCLTDDPKLLCRDMTEARQIAAGLSLREGVRHARSVCYHDVVSINMLVTAFGVLVTLLLFGLVKGCLGLICQTIGSWGLHKILQTPRKLDRYYERSLRDQSVVFYDREGWPIHPCTKERTVRVVSKPMEFVLNLIFFVITPCILVYNIIKEIYNRCRSSDEGSSWRPCQNEKNCYSSHDIQNKKTRLRHRRHGTKRWMTSEAEDLSKNIWRRGLHGTIEMRPLLHEEFCRGEKLVAQQLCVDSEGDDTEYVLMQMQKSKESLARSQRKLCCLEK